MKGACCKAAGNALLQLLTYVPLCSGSPGSNHSHFCIGDAPSDGDSEHDSDNGGLDYFVPSDSEDSNVYEQYVAEYL